MRHQTKESDAATFKADLLAPQRAPQMPLGLWDTSERAAEGRARRAMRITEGYNLPVVSTCSQATHSTPLVSSVGGSLHGAI